VLEIRLKGIGGELCPEEMVPGHRLDGVRGVAECGATNPEPVPVATVFVPVVGQGCRTSRAYHVTM